MAELTAPPADAIDINETSVLLGIHADGVRKIRHRGDLTKFYRDESVYPPKYWYSRAEVEELAARRKAQGQQPEDGGLTPMEINFLSVLRSLGAVESKSGRATATIAERLPYRNVNSASRTLRTRGFIDTEISGKRTYRIAMTPRGEAWCAEHLGEIKEATKKKSATAVARKVATEKAPKAPKASKATTVTATVGDRPKALNNSHAPALPELLQSVEVYALAANDDGSFTMGLRDGERRWIATVTGTME